MSGRQCPACGEPVELRPVRRPGGYRMTDSHGYSHPPICPELELRAGSVGYRRRVPLPVPAGAGAWTRTRPCDHPIDTPTYRDGSCRLCKRLWSARSAFRAQVRRESLKYAHAFTPTTFGHTLAALTFCLMAIKTNGEERGELRSVPAAWMEREP